MELLNVNTQSPRGKKGVCLCDRASQESNPSHRRERDVAVALVLALRCFGGGQLRILTNVTGGKTPEEMDLFAKELSEHLGMEVELIKPPSDYGQFVQTTLRGGERYDIIYMTKDLMDVLVSQRALIPLDDFIASSPILSDPAVIPTEEWEQIRYPDGKIYSVFNKYEGGTMPVVRGDWLEKLGLAVPESLDDFYEVLKAFKERDPDGNGIQDTYGLSTAGLYDIQPFMGAFGVKARYVIDEQGQTDDPLRERRSHSGLRVAQSSL